MAPADGGGGGGARRGGSEMSPAYCTLGHHTVLEKVVWGCLVMDLDLKRHGVEEIMCRLLIARFISAHGFNPRIENGKVICRDPRPRGSTFLQAVYELQEHHTFKAAATLKLCKSN